MFDSIIEYYRGVFEGQGTWYIIGQALGIGIVVFNLFVFTQKSRSRILTFKCIADFAGAIENALINAYTGALVTAVAGVRDIIFYNRDKHKWADSIIWLFVFLVAVLVSPILTWAGAISLLPAIGSCFSVIGLYSKDTIVTRIFTFVGSALWLVYQLITANIGGALGTIIALVSIIIGFTAEIKRRKQNKKC